MKKVLLSLGFIALALGANAQVKIKDGTVSSSTTPNSNAILELESNTKGLLFPRVGLQATNLAAPLSQHVKGIVVYDTATAGSGSTAVSPGIYYNDGTQWVRATPAADWLKMSDGTAAGTADDQYITGRAAIGQSSSATIDASNTPAQLTVAGGDANINGVIVGLGGGQLPDNLAAGTLALYNNTDGHANTAVGTGVLSGNTTGNYNTALGTGALGNSAFTGGNNNTILGAGAANNQTGGDSNIAIGYNQTLPNLTASNQMNIGGAIFGTGMSGTAAAPAGNISIAKTTPDVVSTSASSTAAQQLARLTVANGDASINNIIVGLGGGQASSNTAVGNQALYKNTTGTTNTAVGYQALQSNLSGSGNTAVGWLAMNAPNMTGGSNTSVGRSALGGVVNGNNNTALGYNALSANQSGSDNIGIGYGAFLSLKQSSGNIAIGSGSGGSEGNNNTIIGTNSYLFTDPSATENNSNIIIGYNQRLGDASPAIVIANQMNIGGTIFGTGMNGTVDAPAGNIGINVAQPNSTLDVAGSIGFPAKTVSGTYTLTDKDYTVVFPSGNATNNAIILPDAATITAGASSGSPGRIYRIVNRGSYSVNMTTTSGEIIYTVDGLDNQTTVPLPGNMVAVLQCVYVTETSSWAWYQINNIY